MLPDTLTIAGLRALYRSGATPADVMRAVMERIAACPDTAIWISTRVVEDIVAEAAALGAAPRSDQPLWGVPFAVKDNIDCAGLPTTAACPAFSYEPDADAFAVARLRAAGAILIGKTNLDQFATGLNGTRSPYGAPRSVFGADYISGGSSSGSAVAVGSGHAAFALGTDTAGSGRVPAAFNNLVGVKPTKGLVSTSGLVPACRSLDCITVLANSVSEADEVRRLMQGFDAADPYSRAMQPVALPHANLRFGVLGQAERTFFGDDETAALYDAAAARLESLGATRVEIDYAPFRECAALLYGGPWVAERLAAIDTFYDAHASEMDPAVRDIVGSAKSVSAVDAFKGAYALQAFRRRAEAEWTKMDVMLLPTAPTIYRVAEMQEKPIELNSNLGRYTNFVNLLDCAAVAIPAGFRSDGLPAGVTLIAPAFTDDALARLADRLHRAQPFGMGRDRAAPLAGEPLADRPEGLLQIAVVGAHLSGMPLNHQLTSRDGVMLRKTRTAGHYRLFALPNTTPPKPGLMHDAAFSGEGLEIEIWGLTPAHFGAFVESIPAPMGVGRLKLADGGEATGFICEPYAFEGAEDITAFGGWRAYVESRRQ